MADPAVVTAGAGIADPAAEKQPATSAKPVEKPNAAIVGYQRIVAEKDTTITSLRSELAALKGTPGAEEERDALRTELENARAELATSQLKAEFPELADVIDVAIAENGKPPSKALLATLKTKLGAAVEPAPETSGVRNSPASQGNVNSEEARFNRILKETKLW